MSTIDGTRDRRPSKVYRSERCCRIARALAQLGNATDADIAEALGISLSELQLWKDTHPEFAEALKTPPSSGAAAFHRAMLRHALGYSYVTNKTIKTREGKVVRSVSVHVPPHVGTLEFVLGIIMPRFYCPQAKVTDDLLLASLADEILRRSAQVTQLATAEEPVDEETCRAAHVMARLWASDDEIAAALDISVAAFNELQDRDLELAEAIGSGEEWTDTALEEALAKQASGYSYHADEILCTREGDIIRRPRLTDLPPDMKAFEIWFVAQKARSSLQGAKPS